MFRYVTISTYLKETYKYIQTEAGKWKSGSFFSSLFIQKKVWQFKGKNSSRYVQVVLYQISKFEYVIKVNKHLVQQCKENLNFVLTLPEKVMVFRAMFEVNSNIRDSTQITAELP